MATRIQVADILDLFTEGGIAPAVVAGLKPDAPLLHQGLDSIDLPMLAAAAEQKFGVDLSDADATSLRTIHDFIAYLERKRPA
jgi:acyl carrier protein